jgi:hypothetical protein
MVRCRVTDSKIEKDNSANACKIDLKVGYSYLTYDKERHDIIGSSDDATFTSKGGVIFTRVGEPINTPFSSKLIEEIGLTNPDSSLILEWGKSYRNRKGDIKTIIGPHLCVRYSDFFFDTEDRAYDVHGRVNTPYKVESEYDLIEAVTGSDTLPKIHLEIGGYYSNHAGDIVHIVSHHYSKESGYLYSDENNTTYDVFGRFNWATKEESQLDLVEEVPTTPEVESVDEPVLSTTVPTPFLTTEDIHRIAQYTDKIEQIVNKVGLDLEIRLIPSPKEGH